LPAGLARLDLLSLPGSQGSFDLFTQHGLHGWQRRCQGLAVLARDGGGEGTLSRCVENGPQRGYGLDGSTGNALFLIPGGDGPIALNPAITTQNLASASTAAGVPGDGSNATALAAIANQVGIDGDFPGSTPTQTISAMLSGFGTSLQSALNEQTNTSATLQSLQQLQGSITGVSLNDQLTQLVQYTNNLEAAGRALQATSDMTTFLIQEIGR